MRPAFIVLAIASCFWATTRPLADDDLSSADASAAKKIYISKCARCHNFYNPTGYDDREWSVWMAKMRKKARLSPNDYQLLLRYTAQMRASGKAGDEASRTPSSALPPTKAARGQR